MDDLSSYMDLPEEYFPWEKDNKLRRNLNKEPFDEKEPESDPSDNVNIPEEKDPVIIKIYKQREPPFSDEDKLDPRNNSVLLINFDKRILCL